MLASVWWFEKKRERERERERESAILERILGARM